MNSNTVILNENEKNLEQVIQTRAFYAHLFASIVSLVLLFVINLMVSPQYFWAMWVVIGWGFALMAHGVSVYLKYDTFISQAEHKKNLEEVTETKAFYAHIFAFVVSIILIFVINLMVTPYYLWVMWVVVGWGFGLMAHGTTVFVKHGAWWL